ncbi:MAG: type II toxin-antitoxin system RelE/ParE family toxin [Oscillospiraceae bacterium]|nr:type II toxin-antitoxin system RelE/ParE family toxin [Oscillospiraceae bacterium]
MRLKVAPKAIDDIAEIKNYIRDEYDNPTAANRITAKIKKSYKQLKTSPYMGKQLDTVTDIKNDYRFLVCGNYLIFYIADEDVISIDRIIHGKRDYCKLLFGMEPVCDLTEEEANGD